MLRRFFIASLAVFFAAQIFGETPAAPATRPSEEARLRFRDAVILGLVEGITEFLPISSTGHLIIANESLGLNDSRVLVDAEGRVILARKPNAKYPDGVPMTTAIAAKTFAVVIQIGGIAAVVVLYWGQLWSVLMGLLGKDAAGLRLARNLCIALVPAVVLGLKFDDWIDTHLFSIEAVVGALVVGALLMAVVHFWMRARKTDDAFLPSDLSPMQALLVGGCQCLALWPGTSRSMTTIVGGYLAGLSPKRAAEFSFLLGLPTLVGAAVLKGAKTGPAMLEVFGFGPVILGCFVAFVSAAIAIKLLVAMLTRFGLLPFAIYRVVAAGLLWWLLLS